MSNASRTKRKPVKGIGGTILRLRQKQDVGLAALAGRANIGKGLLSKIETTPFANPELNTLIAIAKAFNVKLWWLFHRHHVTGGQL